MPGNPNSMNTWTKNYCDIARVTHNDSGAADGKTDQIAG